MVVEVVEGFANEGQKQRLNQGGAHMDYSSNQNIEALKFRVCSRWEFHILDKLSELGFR